MTELLHDRVEYCVRKLGGTVRAELQTGIPKSTLGRWTRPDAPDIPSQAARALAEAAKVSLLWLITGNGSPESEAGAAVLLPFYDVKLSAGAASFSDGAKLLGRVPIDRELLRSLRRTDAEDLGFLGIEGDSMEPTISDNARVLVDFRDNRLRDGGVYAFRSGDDLRVKRLHLRAGGAIEVISDNRRYDMELIQREDLNDFAVIGRAVLAITLL